MPDLLKFGSPSLDEYELDGIRSVLDTDIFVHGSMVQGLEAKFKSLLAANAVGVAGMHGWVAYRSQNSIPKIRKVC